jgi:hypothetical protein
MYHQKLLLLEEVLDDRVMIMVEKIILQLRHRMLQHEENKSILRQVVVKKYHKIHQLHEMVLMIFEEEVMMFNL